MLSFLLARREATTPWSLPPPPSTVEHRETHLVHTSDYSIHNLSPERPVDDGTVLDLELGSAFDNLASAYIRHGNHCDDIT